MITYNELVGDDDDAVPSSRKINARNFDTNWLSSSLSASCGFRYLADGIAKRHCHARGVQDAIVDVIMFERFLLSSFPIFRRL